MYKNSYNPHLSLFFFVPLWQICQETLKMSSIQDIHALELRITNIVDDYANQMYNEDDVLAIDSRYSTVSKIANSCIYLN